MWEEPCISGRNGSGTIFFSGCTLKCCFCQNYKISSENLGQDISVDRLAEIMLELQSQNAHNINLVNPTHYVTQIIEALDKIKGKLHIPVVYNSGGYENVETLKMLKGYVQIYMPDFKYADNKIAEKYSCASDYFEVCKSAIKEMYRQVGVPEYDDNDILQSGLIVRHLTLPTHRHDSIKVLDTLSKTLPQDAFLLSLMSQYTPFYKANEYKEISRCVSTFEYNFVADYAIKLGLLGFMQERSSAKEEYTPNFDLHGI